MTARRPDAKTGRKRGPSPDATAPPKPAVSLSGARSRQASLNDNNDVEWQPNLKRQIEIAALFALSFLTTQFIQHQRYLWLLPVAVALLVYGFRRPRDLLILALVLSSLDVGLTGDLDNHIPVIFSISDVLLLMALPGAMVRLYRRPDIWKLGGMGLPMLCYLVAGLLSFFVNLAVMGSHSLGYFGGWIRNAQLVLVAPLMYASFEWRWADLRATLRGYLLCSALIAIWGLVVFWQGMREGLYILGIHKNVLGLALALAALIALVACLPPARRERFADRLNNLLNVPAPLLFGVFGVCLLALVCSLSRGSLLSLVGGFLFVCVVWRKPALFAALLLLTGAVIYGVRQTLPLESREYTTNFSTRSASIGERLGMFQISAARFRARPLLGDGFRIRREIIPHNMAAMVLAENGLIGFVCMVWGMFAQFRLLRRSYRAFAHAPLLQSFVAIVSVCAVALLINGQVEPYWRRGPLLLAWAGTGIVCSLLLRHEREAAEIRAAEAAASSRQDAPVETLELPAPL